MAWIESHQELAGHPKVRRLAKALGITIPAAIGHLHLLWWWAVDYAPDGDLTEFSPAEVATAMLWRDDADTLMKAMMECRWIDNHATDVVIHDWPDYGAKRVRDRQNAADRQRRLRERRGVTRDVTRDKRDSNALRHADVTRQQDRTGQDKDSTRARAPAAGLEHAEDTEWHDLREQLKVCGQHYTEDEIDRTFEIVRSRKEGIKPFGYALKVADGVRLKNRNGGGQTEPEFKMSGRNAAAELDEELRRYASE